MLRLVKRIRNRLVAYADDAISFAYRERHPGPFERRLFSFFSPMIALFQPNDKWNLHVLAPRWVRGIDAPAVQPLPSPKRIFIFCTYRGVFTTHLALAVMLVWRGHRVTIGYLPKLQSPNKPPLVDHPSAKPYLHSVLDRMSSLTGGKIECIDLSEDTSDAQIDHDFVAQQARYDTVMALQKEAFELADPATRQLYDHMVSLGEKAQVAVRNHFRNNRYDNCIVGNGTTFEGAHACAIIKSLSHDVNGTEKFAFRGVRVINHGDHFLAGDDVDYLWQEREALGYTREPYLSDFLARAKQSIFERSQNSTTTWLWELQRAANQTEADALRAANIPADQPFILLCPNVVFDAGYGKITNIFPSMKEWLYETVKFLLENSEHLIVVRAHPGEGLWWGGKEPVDEFLAHHGLTSNRRLVVIPGQAKVSTYRLMELCMFGIVFSSSTGLEMAVMGKQVVVASDVTYAGRGFTIDATNKEDYFVKLGAIAGMKSPPALDEQRRDLALLFYFIYHWVAQYPYPYDKQSGITRCPPAKMLRKDMSPYLPYLDLLSMTRCEFQSHAHHYLGASQIQSRLAWHDASLSVS